MIMPPRSGAALPAMTVGRPAVEPGSMPMTNAVVGWPRTSSVVMSRSTALTSITPGTFRKLSAREARRNEALRMRFVVLSCATQASTTR